MQPLRATLASGLFAAYAAAMLAGCASSGSGDRTTIIKDEPQSSPTAGLSPDKEAEVQLVLQQREVSTRKCYQDVLNEKADRNFQGTVKLVIALGTDGAARDVRIVGGTLPQSDVQPCLIETIKRFEFPTLSQPGEAQSEFTFRPAY